MTAEDRSESARKAVRARWAKFKSEVDGKTVFTLRPLAGTR